MYFMINKIDLEGLETRAIHAGQSPDLSSGDIMTPIYATSTYVQHSPGGALSAREATTRRVKLSRPVLPICRVAEREWLLPPAC